MKIIYKKYTYSLKKKKKNLFIFKFFKGKWFN